MFFRCKVKGSRLLQGKTNTQNTYTQSFDACNKNTEHQTLKRLSTFVTSFFVHVKKNR